MTGDSTAPAANIAAAAVEPMKAARAAAIASSSGTSNLAAVMRYGLAPVGTMAHSYVMSFEREEDAFRACMEDFPGRLKGGELNATGTSALVAVHTEYLGRGRGRASTVRHRHVLVTLMHDVLTAAEKSLTHTGRIDAVQHNQPPVP